jgi:hypothetical protein
MRRFYLFTLCPLTVAVQAVACWMYTEGERGPQTGGDWRPLWPPLWIGLAIAFMVQLFAWNTFPERPDNHRRFLRNVLAIATTLVSMAPGMWISLLIHHDEFNAFEGTGYAMAGLGMPAFVVGGLLFLWAWNKYNPQ